MKNIIGFALASILGICLGALIGFIFGLQFILGGNLCLIKGNFLACFWGGQIYAAHLLLIKYFFIKFADSYYLSKFLGLMGIIALIISFLMCLWATLRGINVS
jgi:hypothetical protein